LHMLTLAHRHGCGKKTPAVIIHQALESSPRIDNS
jgi:hypothetical protein